MDVSSHIFTNTSFSQVIEKALEFFGGTNCHDLPLSEKFEGAGVYGIYYNGSHPIYTHLNDLKLQGFNIPIYIGKAVPPGWRQGRKDCSPNPTLFRRLNEHCKSISATETLNLSDFECRFAILNGEISSLIGVLESELINRLKPIWNSCIDGFGIHAPGAGRAQQARSKWDTIHPGRPWATDLNDNSHTDTQITREGIDYLLKLGSNDENT